MIQRIRQFLHRSEESDIFLCAGVESLFYGTHQIYPPAAYILIGAIFVALAVVQAAR